MTNPGDLQLGQQLDLTSGVGSGDPLIYDRDDLTTHGVIVGMTGSGKTGLAIVLLEEALASGVPALILDPKGDMPNLLLNFPDFAPADFEPWINADEARADGKSPTDFAAEQATRWRSGLEAAGVTPDRMRALLAGTHFQVFTPGSSSGTPLNIIGDLSAPADPTNLEAIRDEAGTLVSGLLALVDVEADPLASREHILLANIIEDAWSAGRGLDLPTLLSQVLQPPFRKLGIFEVDTFFPEADRRALAMRLNGLVASPTFASWTMGQPLDMGSLLYGADGKPCATIIYLAHLSDAERQFVVSLVFARLVTWMRAQSGTNSLRALAYMDEVAGFVPPTAEPPAKKPILTLLKQARAYGVGLVLATQNPVDLDYKAMSNAGTWMVGRLQTERDKARVLEALSAADGSADLAAIDAAISALGPRQFILHNTHDSKGPHRFAARWAMSYLRGPLTANQLKSLPHLEASTTAASAAATPPSAPAAPPSSPEPVAASNVEAAAPAASTPAPAAPALADDETQLAPAVPAGVPVRYVDPAAAWASQVGAVAGGLRLKPMIAAQVHLHFDETRAGLDHREEWEALIPVDDGARIDEAVHVDFDSRDFRPDAPAGAIYQLPHARLEAPAFFREVEQQLKLSLQRAQRLEVLANRQLKLYSRVGETEEQFRARCLDAAHAEADREATKLRDTFEGKMDRINAAIARAEDRVQQADEDTKTRRTSEMVSAAGSLLSVFLGGKSSATSIVGKLGRSAGGMSSRRGTTTRTAQRLENARDEVGRRQDELHEIEADLQDDLADVVEHWDEIAAGVEKLDVGLERDDVEIDEVALVWVPIQ